MYILEQGMCEVLVKGQISRKDVFVKDIGPGAIFGEIALTLENYGDKRELLRLLDNASHVCPACGEAFSNPRSSSAASLFATFHMGHCDVCKHHTSVTSTRDYGYLSAGIETLKLLLSKRQTSTKNKSDASIKNFLNMCSKRGI
jgi:hypothetical protein